LNNNFCEHEDDEEEDADDISVSSEEEEEPTPVSQPTPTPVSQPTPTPLRQPIQPTHVARVNPIRQFSSLGEEILLFGERVDEASRVSVYTLSGFRVPEFTQTKLRQLEVVHVDVPEVFVLHSVPRKEYCDSGLRLSEVDPDSGQLFITKGMQFDNLEEVKFFLRDYSMRHHRPYNVIHSSAKTRYTVACEQDCAWKVWARPLPDDRNKWRITRVVLPHTCGTSEVAQEHSQCTARYISRRIAAMVYKDPDVSIAAIIESIKAFSNYTVNYEKAWRAKQHAISMLWGDWKDAYGRVPKILQAITSTRAL
jgi:hypothetical protein